ncbi:MAG: hypothetical protein U5L09_21010 [Bacteroidales bacterium]|nr:hypothetical protein [Bacteroidales bacterium]
MGAQILSSKLKSVLSLIHSEYEFSEAMSDVAYSGLLRDRSDLQQSKIRLHFDHAANQRPSSVHMVLTPPFITCTRGDFLPLTQESRRPAH